MLCLPTAPRESLARSLHWSILQQVQSNRIAAPFAAQSASNLSFVCILLTSSRKLHPSFTKFSRKLAPKWYPHRSLQKAVCAADLPSKLPYAYGPRSARSHRPLLRRPCRLQTTGPRAGPRRWPRTPPAARAARPPHRTRLTRQSRPRSMELPPGSRGTHQSHRRATRPPSRRLRLRPPHHQYRQRQREVDDIFIPPAELNGAMQGDLVLVELLPPRDRGPNAGKLPGASSRSLTAATPPSSAASSYATSEACARQLRRPLRRAHDAAHPHPLWRRGPALGV